MKIDLLENICAKCSEEQRQECKYARRGCDEFYEWRSNHIDLIVRGIELLEKEKKNDNRRR